MELEDAMKAIGVTIFRLDLTKPRPVSSSLGTWQIDKFRVAFKDRLGQRAMEFPNVFKMLHSSEETIAALEEYARGKNLLIDANTKSEIQIHDSVKHLTLNCNLSAKTREDRFFCTNSDETIAKISGPSFLLLCGMSESEAIGFSRLVIPEYLPREPAGVMPRKSGGKIEDVFNLYIPPAWKNYKEIDELPDELPLLFEKLVNHLFPIKDERRYFFSWLYASMFERAFVYLILCGMPGSGKNRLKLTMRALHGHSNSVDGKRSTLSEKFNSQLSDSTLVWFDELQYEIDMENVMKELQNDSIAIERKGVDATRGTRIHASSVISNNKPRDNYIAFDARKFVPLKITNKRLEESMSLDEINELTLKVENEDSDTFDIKFLAQIAKWVKRYGRSNRWPNLEYKGPMFWTLAHTSMVRWQKKAILTMQHLTPDTSSRVTHNINKGYLWSSVQEMTQRKHSDKSLQFPDYTSVQFFFDIFKDGNGEQAFSTEAVGGDIMGDFWVKPLFTKLDIVTESKVLLGRGGNSEIQKRKKPDRERIEL